MEKRLFLAVLISIAFLWAWGALAPRFFPELFKKPASEQKAVTPKASSPSTATAVSGSSAPAVPAVEPAPSVVEPVAATSQIVSTIDEPAFTAKFSNAGAQLVSFKLKGYKRHNGELVELVKDRIPAAADYPFAIQTADREFNAKVNHALFAVQEIDAPGAKILEYRYAADGVEVTKTFRVTSEYRFDFAVKMTGRALPYRVVVGPGIRNLDPDEAENKVIAVGSGVVQRDGSLKVFNREKLKGVQAFDGIPQYVGVEDNFFLTVLQPKIAAGAVIVPTQVAVAEGEEKSRKEVYAGLNASGGVVTGQAFFGPKKADVLEKYGLEKTLQFGAFGFIARLLLQALIFIFTFTKNYGWAIVVLTILIKIVLYPLQHKSIVSMKKMQNLQPKVNALRDKYKKAKTDADQRQKLNLEMMKLYKDEGANPMSGCLPILLQLPILWAFYGLLYHSIELRGSEFIWWIHDLSAKDPYYVTPILMTATMFIQQWITPTTADPVQKKMFMIMPVVFGWIFKEMPSGLVLYWLVQNVLTIIQQLIMNKWWKEHPAELK